MSDHFFAYESSAAGVRRVAVGAAREARELLENPELAPADAVHEARKKIKRLRALLRLVRPTLGKAFDELNDCLRETARSLAAVREASAALESFELLLERKPTRIDAQRIAEIRPMLASAAPAARHEIRDLLAGAAAALSAVEQRIADLELEGRGFELLEPGLRADYRRVRRRLEHAHRHLTPEAFHELRIAVKAHQYQLQLLETAWPEVLKARRQVVSDLSELLGQHHDLALLGPSLRARFFSDAAGAVDERLAELELEILGAARVPFAERPRTFTDAVGAWFEEFQRGVTAAR